MQTELDGAAQPGVCAPWGQGCPSPLHWRTREPLGAGPVLGKRGRCLPYGTKTQPELGVPQPLPPLLAWGPGKKATAPGPGWDCRRRMAQGPQGEGGMGGREQGHQGRRGALSQIL